MRLKLAHLPRGPIVATALCLAAPMNAHSADLSCGAFDLVGANKTTDIVDAAPDGDSPGDTRIGMRELVDETGSPIGALHFVSTLIRLGESDDHHFSGDFQIVLPDGFLIGSTIYQRPNVVNQDTPPLTVVLTGGTGAYRDASGILEIGAGETPTYSFDLTCD